MNRSLLRRIRFVTGLFMVGLVLSGATAIPLQGELDTGIRLLGIGTRPGAGPTGGWAGWLIKVRDALHDTDAKYPFIAYGFDWLAFGHFVIAIAFVWAWRDPVRNMWLYRFGMIACALVVPYAWLFGEVRGIPQGWRLVDCAFGVLGFIPLWLCHRWTGRLADSPPIPDLPHSPPDGLWSRAS